MKNQYDLQVIKAIGEYIKNKRVQQGLTQSDLAQKSGVSHPSITRLETGTGNISLSHLIAILSALNLLTEFERFFSSPVISPALLAKATSRHTKTRVRKKSSPEKTAKKPWTWGEDQS